MQNVLLRVLKYQTRNYLIPIPFYITTAIIFYFYIGFLDNNGTVESAMVGVVIIMPLAFQSSFFRIYFKQMLSFSLTRKNEFLLSLINKIYYCLFGILVSYGLNIYNKSLQINNILSLVFIFIFSFLLATILDFIVFIFLKFTKLIYVFSIFFLSIALFGATIGLIISSFDKYNIIAFVVNWNSVIVCFLLSLVLLFINWKCSNKLEIRFQK